MDEASVYQAFGKTVAAKRRLLRKTQAEVAKAVGLSRGSLANIELGNQKVFLHQVLALAYALELQSAHEIVPGGALGPIEKGATRPRVSGKSLSAKQRAEIAAMLRTLSFSTLPGRGDAS